MKETEQNSFQNDFGRISLKSVILNQCNKEFGFLEIAYIEIKEKKILFGKKYFIRIIFTKPGSIDFLVSKKKLEQAKEFELFFLKLRTLFPQLE